VIIYLLTGLDTMHALLPIKNLSNAKERLSNLLDKTRRQGLFRAMTDDVISVLIKHPGISEVAIISDDPFAARLAKKHKAGLFTERALRVRGLNAVIQAAVSRLALRQIDNVMIIHADLPLINATNLSKLISMHNNFDGPRLTLAPDRHRNGTNCLLCNPASAFTFQYGKDSFRNHCAEANSLRFSIQVLDDPQIGCDIDYPQDVTHFLDLSKGGTLTSTGKYLCKNGITHTFIRNSYKQTSSQGQHYERVS
jgi:2-phospho-L-lactate guanylyltransferase